MSVKGITVGVVTNPSVPDSTRDFQFFGRQTTFLLSSVFVGVARKGTLRFKESSTRDGLRSKEEQNTGSEKEEMYLRLGYPK